MSKETAMALATTSPTPPAPVNVPSEPVLQAAEPPKPADLESTRYAHLAKKEAHFVKEREEFKKEREIHLQEKEKMKAIHKKLQDFEELKVKDPVAALKLAGFSETDLFNFIAAHEDTSTPEEKAAKAAQAEIKKFQDEQSKKEKEAQEKRNQEVLAEFRSDITKQIASEKDKFEYCNYYGTEAESLIEETISAILADSKELVSVKEAAEMVETFYEERDKAMSTLKKRQPKETPISTQDAPARPEAARVSKTLSERTSATIASTTTIKHETRDQKKARLIEKLANLGK